MRKNLKDSGFTLLEIILVIVISGILGGVIMQVVGDVTKGYTRQSARQELVGTARAALTRMKRDIRKAVPGTIWVSSDNDRITFFIIEDGGRFDSIDTNNSSDSFEIYGVKKDYNNSGQNLLVINPGFVNIKSDKNSYNSPSKSPYASIDSGPVSSFRLTEYDWTSGPSGKTAYINEVSLNGDDTFAHSNPANRIFLTKTAVSYWVEESGNTKSIRRESQTIDSGQVEKSFGDGNSPVLVDRVSKLVFDKGKSLFGDLSPPDFRRSRTAKNLVGLRLELVNNDLANEAVKVNFHEEIRIQNAY